MRLVECGVIRTKSRDPLPARLREIHQGVSDLIARHKPDHLAVEDVFYSRNVRTTLALGHARGVRPDRARPRHGADDERRRADQGEPARQFASAVARFRISMP